MLTLMITFCVGLAGGVLFLRLKVPGGMMVGALVAVTAFNLCCSTAFMPTEAKVAAQSLAGAFIACGIGKDDIKSLTELWKPALLLIFGMLMVNLLIGTIIWLISPLDLLTSLMCAVPGGMSDTPMIAADMGADAGKVAILQFVRMSAGIGIFPSVILWLSKEPRVQGQPHSGGTAGSVRKTQNIGAFLITLLAAFGCGILGKLSGIPAGTLVFSLLGVLALKLIWGRSYLPMWAKRLAQVLSGAYIGCSIAKDDLLELRYLLFPAVILLVGYFLNSIVMGKVLTCFCGFPLKEAMLTATPAGASDMALISADLGVTDKKVVELQIIRMVTVIVLFPQIISLIVVLQGQTA